MVEIQGTYSGQNTKEFFVGDSLNLLTKGTWTGTIILQRRAKLSDEFVDYRNIILPMILTSMKALQKMVMGIITVWL